LLNKPAISSVIVGGRKAEHLEDNIRAVQRRIQSERIWAKSTASRQPALLPAA
jgi:aryl-alcohol dehydrogenase-like predicted oxidoreductase